MSGTQWDDAVTHSDSLVTHELERLRAEQLRQEANQSRTVTTRAQRQTTGRSRSATPRPRIVVGPVERSVTRSSQTFTVRNPADSHHGVTVGRHTGASASDLPITGSERRVGRSGWRRSGAKSPFRPSDPTARAALDTSVRVERTDAVGRVIQNRTRTGTTLWIPK